MLNEHGELTDIGSLYLGGSPTGNNPTSDTSQAVRNGTLQYKVVRILLFIVEALAEASIYIGLVTVRVIAFARMRQFGWLSDQQMYLMILVGQDRVIRTVLEDCTAVARLYFWWENVLDIAIGHQLGSFCVWAHLTWPQVFPIWVCYQMTIHLFVNSTRRAGIEFGG